MAYNFLKTPNDPLLKVLNRAVFVSVKILAIMMVAVIWLALLEVFIHFSQKISLPYQRLFSAENLIETLGDFLLVLIAIEIFLNIIFYLHSDKVQVSLVLATALTAVARKVIIMNYQEISALHVFAIATIIFSVGITYWLVIRQDQIRATEEKRATH